MVNFFVRIVFFCLIFKYKYTDKKRRIIGDKKKRKSETK